MRWLIGQLAWVLEKVTVLLAHVGRKRDKRRRRATNLEFLLRASPGF